MKKIIAVGGTGIRCLESFLYTNAINGLNNGLEDVFDVLIVDSDVSGNLTRVQEVAGSYAQIKKLFPRREKDRRNDLPFANTFVLDKDGAFKRWSIVDDTGFELRQYIDNTDYISKELLDVLYAPDETGMNFEKGVHGKPKVGSLVMDNFLKEELKKPGSIWYNFIGQGNTDIPEADTTSVMIMGSVFGGTGASGLRAIAKRIINFTYDMDEKEVKYVDLIAKGRLKLSILMMLPYFDLPKRDEEARQKSDEFGLSDIVANTAYALDYYAEDQHLLENVSMILVGKANREKLCGKYSEGGITQKNKSMTPELVAAFGINDFFREEIDKKTLAYSTRASSADNFTIGWDNIPTTLDFRERVLDMLVFALFYRYKIYPVLKAGEFDTASHPWLNLCVKNLNDKSFKDDRNDIKNFCEQYIDWVFDVMSISEDYHRTPETYAMIDEAGLRLAIKYKVVDETDYGRLVNGYNKTLIWKDIMLAVNKIGEKAAKKIVRNKPVEQGLDRVIAEFYKKITGREVGNRR